MTPIPYSKPSLDEADVNSVVGALRSGWLSFGSEKQDFESQFGEYIGAAHAVSANSCTSALELTMRALRVRGEVIVPSFTWVASASAIVNAGAIPVFCDVDERSRNMTAETVEAVMTRRTEAVLVVHYGGHACAMDELDALCRRKGLLLIEDCAQTLGGTFAGKKTGSFGHGCFSFYPTKAMTCGEGGMLTTNDSTLATRFRALSSHGLRSDPPMSGAVHNPWERAAEEFGHNYRLSNVLAALGLSQLKRVDDMNSRRIAIADRYRNALAGLEGRVDVPAPSSQVRHVYQMFTVQVPRNRDKVLRDLWKAGIGANVHFDPPVHRQPVFAKSRAAALPTTDKLSREILSLPIYPDLGADDQLRVVAALIKAVGAC